MLHAKALTGGEIKRVYVDKKANRGHDAPSPFRVYRSGQKRGVHGVIRKQLRRRAAIEALIGHLKIDGHLGRNYLKGHHGDHAVVQNRHEHPPRLNNDIPAVIS